MGVIGGHKRESLVMPINTDTGITLAHHQRVLDVTAGVGGDVTITVPAAGSLPDGFECVVRRNAASASNVVLQTGVSRTLTEDGEGVILVADSGGWVDYPTMGPTGADGPNEITSSTDTDLTGTLRGDAANVFATKDKLDATVPPDNTNDTTEGYAVGSRWADVSGDKEYVCLDATEDAAVWKCTTPNLAADGVLYDSDFAANGTMERTGAGAYTTILNKRDATTAPTVDDDSGDGYAVGSRWLDVTNHNEYVCEDPAVGAAVWKKLTGVDAHASTHQSGGSDAIKLDDLAAPDDNTDLNVSTSAHGLCPKAPNDTSKALLGDGTWGTPAGTSGLPRGYIDGLILSNAADADHDITIATGEARDSTDAYDLALASAITKQIDASWAAGNNAGGLDTGSVGNSTWYHVWLIRKDSDGSIDALFSTSATAPTMPAGYTYKRRLGSVLTNGSANIIAFKQDGDYFYWATFAEDMATTPTAATVAVTISVPLGIVVEAIVIAWYQETTTARYFYLRNFDEVTLESVCYITVPGLFYGGEAVVKTNASSQIKYVASHASGTAAIRTNGWIDPRGKDA